VARTPPYRRIPAGKHGLSAEEVFADQGARLRAAMVQVVSERGYGPMSVEQVITVANVSRRAYYAHFPDKEGCFLATFELVLGEWRKQLVASFRASAPGEQTDVRGRVRAALGSLLEQVSADPMGARVLFVEGLAAGPAGQERVAAVVEELAAIASRLLDGGESEPQVDRTVATGVVLGVIELVAGRLLARRPEAVVEFVDPLTDWAVGYRDTNARAILDAITPTRVMTKPDVEAAAPTLGTTGLWNEATARPIRLPADAQSRILAAVVDLAGDEGYAALSINRIVGEAHVSQRTFRTLFPTAHEAFIAAFTAGGRETMAFCFPFVIAAKDWSTSVVAGLAAQTRFFGDRPRVARFGFLPVFSSGAEGLKVRGMELELWAAALQPGFRMNDARPMLIAGAIGGGIWRTMAHTVLRESPAALPQLAGPLAFLALEPFLGPITAARTIRSYLEDD
jgi:AcrR family transcriptional regulator